MAPRETTKDQRVKSMVKTKINTTIKPVALSTATSTIKKTLSVKRLTERTPLKVKSENGDSGQANKISSAASPNTQENKPTSCAGSVTKSAKKSWQRRPKPAHSGVPVPEKMRKMQQLLFASDHSS